MFVKALLRHETRWSARPSQAVQLTHEADGGITYEVAPDFLEHVHYAVFQQPAGRTAPERFGQP